MKKNIYCVIIVDDEEKARKNLANVLAGHSDMQIVAEASNANEAIKLITDHQPDILFLDIKMPEIDGFGVLDVLQKKQLCDFEIIFLTAYENYAIKAIKYAAFDYLLKPIDPDELSTALNNFRLKQKKANNLNIEDLKEVFNPCPKLRVPVKNGFEFINPNEILYIEGEGAYSNIFTTNSAKLMACRNLKNIEEELQQYNFIRVHKAYLINKSFLSAFNKNTQECTLKYFDKTINIPVSQRMVKNISL